MNLTPILKSMLLILLFGTASALAQDSLMVSPPLTAKPGTMLTVRVNEPLSSDHNKVGDTFFATLTEPVIVQGIVVARYGQAAAGRVVEAKKAGKVSGVSRLGITLTSLTLVDGQTIPIQSRLLLYNGATSAGRDAAVIAGTTGLGAAVGAAAGWGKGAAIGAAAGAAVGAIGVLLTRGSPTVLDSETPLTFEITATLTIETNDAPQAFRFVERTDYPFEQIPSRAVVAYPAPAPYPYPYYVSYPAPIYPYFYPYWGYPYFYGPSFSFLFGYPGYYHHRGYPWVHYGHVFAFGQVPYRPRFSR